MTLYQRKSLHRKSSQSIHNKNVCYCSGNFDRRRILTYVLKKISSVSLNFGKGVSSCCSRQIIKWRRISLTSNAASIDDFLCNIPAAHVIVKGPQLQPSVCLCTGECDFPEFTNCILMQCVTTLL